MKELEQGDRVVVIRNCRKGHERFLHKIGTFHENIRGLYVVSFLARECGYEVGYYKDSRKRTFFFEGELVKAEEYYHRDFLDKINDRIK